MPDDHCLSKFKRMIIISHIDQTVMHNIQWPCASKNPGYSVSLNSQNSFEVSFNGLNACFVWFIVKELTDTTGFSYDISANDLLLVNILDIEFRSDAVPWDFAWRSCSSLLPSLLNLTVQSPSCFG